MGWSNFLFWGLGLGMGWLLSKLLQSANGSPSDRAAAEYRSQPQAVSTELAETTEQLQQVQLAYRMAAEMEQFKATFLARTSHELRSPLNSIISLHQLILSDLSDSPEEEREFIAQGYSAAQKMLSRLDELIQVSKVEAGTTPLQLQPVQIASLFEEVRSLTYLQAQNRSLRLEVDRPDSAIYVTADPRWLRQVLLHLITNAIASMREGTIRVSTQASPTTRTAQITVTDERPAAIASRESEDEPGLNRMIDSLLLIQMQGNLQQQRIGDTTQTRCTLPLTQPPLSQGAIEPTSV